ncbi:MAG: tetratricopeptide repeat protein [Thermodesulfobacteriota bacterium]
MNKSAIKIMIVNDKVDLRNIVRDYLKNDGYSNLLVSENGMSALRRAANDLPDLIIADYDLPGLNGLQLLKEIRSNRDLAETPFLLISSEAEQKYVALAAEHRVNAFIVKPFSQQTLSDKVNHILESKLNPGDSDLLYQDGNRLVLEGRLEEALERYSQALTGTRRTLAAIHYKMGRAREKMEQQAEAEEDYRQAVNMSELYVEAYDALGSLTLRQNRTDEALGFFRRGVNISPLNAQRQFNLGESLLAAGDFEAAEKAFKMALDLDPSQTHALNRLGISLRRQGKLNEAKDYLLRAAEATPDDENLFYNLGRVCLDQGDPDAAKSYLDKALALKPDFKEALELKSQLGNKGN